MAEVRFVVLLRNICLVSKFYFSFTQSFTSVPCGKEFALTAVSLQLDSFCVLVYALKLFHIIFKYFLSCFLRKLTLIQPNLKCLI